MLEPDYGSQWIGNIAIGLAFCVVMFGLWLGEHVYARHQVGKDAGEDDGDEGITGVHTVRINPRMQQSDCQVYGRPGA